MKENSDTNTRKVNSFFSVLVRKCAFARNFQPLNSKPNNSVQKIQAR